VLDTLRADLLRLSEPGARYQDAQWNTGRIIARVLTQQGAWAVIEYRFRRWIRGLPAPARIPLTVVRFLSSKLIETLTGISIASGADIGRGLFVGHLFEIVVGPGVRIGENCNLSQGVTIGDHRGSPTVGSCVYFAPGAKAFGPITIGDHVAVGANTVVSESVPSACTVVAGRSILLEGRGNLLPVRTCAG
jgi:serine O-acetyltransferase